MCTRGTYAHTSAFITFALFRSLARLRVFADGFTLLVSFLFARSHPPLLFFILLSHELYDVAVFVWCFDSPLCEAEATFQLMS